MAGDDSPAGAVGAPATSDGRMPASSLRRLQATTFVSAFDRMAIVPLLVLIGAGFDASLSQVTLAATAYFVLYGVGQPFWGVMTDRFGRVRVLRVTLAGAAVAAAASALAPSLATLVVARGVAGLLFGAAVPTGLVYIGDTVAVRHRQPALADLMAATASGLAVAAAVAGLVAGAIGWRAVFALAAVAALGLVFALRDLPEPVTEPRGPALATVRELLSSPWPLVVLGLVLVEGAVGVGLITFFAPALQDSGVGVASAGLVMALYGASVLGWTRAVKSVVARSAPATLIGVGGTFFAASYLVAWTDPAVTGIGAAAVLSAGGYAFMHSSLQTWATQVAAELRATMISLFAGCLFLGGGIATAVAAPLAGDGDFTTVFALGGLVAVPLGIAATLARRRFDRGGPDAPGSAAGFG